MHLLFQDENSSILRKPPCSFDSQLQAGKVGTRARDSLPFADIDHNNG